jgi:sensor domain CHASE-containing protein
MEVLVLNLITYAALAILLIFFLWIIGLIKETHDRVAKMEKSISRIELMIEEQK